MEVNLISTQPAESLFGENRSTSKEIAVGFDYEYETCANRFSLVKYEGSGLVVLDPRPSVDSLSIIYPNNYEPYNFHKMGRVLTSARNFVQKIKVRQIDKYLPVSGRLIDIGCGNGSLLVSLARFSRQKVELHANDIHLPSLEALTNLGIKTHQGSCLDLPYENYFDVIVLNQVIEHFSDPKAILSACLRLLKPSGIIFIETPSTDGLDAKLFRSGSWGGYHIPRHFYLFNESNLTRLLQEQGFCVSEVSYLLSPAFWTQSFHHALYRLGLKKVAKFFHLKNILLTGFVVVTDWVLINLGAKTSNMRIVAIKRGEK